MAVEHSAPLLSAAEGEVRIRELQEDDLPRVLEIERESFSTPWHESTFRGLLRREDTDLLGAEMTGRLVGYSICWTVMDQAELGNLAIAGELQGRGTGRILLEAAMHRLRQRRVRECFLEVRESNHVARKLYETSAFVVVGHRKGYYSRPTEDALVMRRLLA